jgi:hypothetical protein
MIASGASAQFAVHLLQQPELVPAAHEGSYTRLDAEVSPSDLDAIHVPAHLVALSAEESADAASAECGCEESAYGGNCDCSRNYGLGGLCSLIQPSDHCFDDFISPMTNPVFFEDPRNLTEARVIFLNHKVPLTAGGGDIQLYATQLRAALTDRLSLIASKDGYIVSQNPVVGDGWADVSAGVKYLLYSDSAAQQLLSAGVVYEIPLGTHDARQGQGDGTFDLFLTGGSRIGCHGHWIGAGGIVLPTDDEANSTWCYISNHFDYEFYPGVYALTEFNWYHWLESGGNGIPGIEGGDLFNFGSTGVAGNNIVTGAFGLKYKPSGHTEIGVAWEVPLTERRDVLENRLTFDWIFRY